MSGVLRGALAGLLILMPGCAIEDTTEPHFDGPVAAAVLMPGETSPFEEPVGFVSNSRSGRITLVDLKHGRILTDQPSASFLRGTYLATGRARVLGDVAVYAPAADRISAFVVDHAHDALLEVPYIVGLDPWPVKVEPEASELQFEDTDESGDSVSISNLELRRGYTTTEDWLLEYDGEAWLVTGSRSGRQEKQARFGERYNSGYREVEFTLSGTATQGDMIRFSTDTGVVEHQIGVVESLAMSPSGDLIALTTVDPDGAAGSLLFFDPDASTLLGALPLEEGARPYRLTWDETGDLLYAGDLNLPVVWEVLLDPADPLASGVAPIEVPGPVLDVAYVRTDDLERLVIAPAAENRVYLYDLLEGALLDLNSYTEEVEGMPVHSPITGLATVPVEEYLPQTTDWGARLRARVVAISLFSGHMVFMDVETGCLAQDEDGPRPVETTSGFSFDDYGAASDPYLLTDPVSGARFQLSSCAGLARSETWTVMFDQVEQAWWVEGSITGPQEGLARPDTRYVTDRGELSFTIMEGAQPTTDGDTWTINVESGVLTASGDRDRDGAVERPLELPGRPVGFYYDAGPTGGGWDPLDRRGFLLWPVTNSDVAARVRVREATLEVVWD